MALARATTHTTAADGTFSALGATEWNRAHTMAITGADVGGLSYFPTASTEATNANLAFSATGSVSGGPLFTIGSGSAGSTGWSLGNDLSGYGGIWSTAVTASTTNYTLATNGTTVFLNTVSGGSIRLSAAGNSVLEVFGTAGQGAAITAGIAATDVAVLSITRTNNNAAVATGVKWTFTDTTSAAGFLPFQILGGVGGVTNLLSIGKTGIVTVGDILVLKGYTVASLPAGVDGAIALITDQLTTVAAKGVAPTGGGAVHCAVIYNGAAWVGI